MLAFESVFLTIVVFVIKIIKVTLCLNSRSNLRPLISEI